MAAKDIRFGEDALFAHGARRERSPNAVKATLLKGRNVVLKSWRPDHHQGRRLRRQGNRTG